MRCYAIWLTLHEVRAFVALDDLPLEPILCGHAVACNPARGLDETGVDKALELLRRDDAPGKEAKRVAEAAVAEHQRLRDLFTKGVAPRPGADGGNKWLKRDDEEDDSTDSDEDGPAATEEMSC